MKAKLEFNLPDEQAEFRLAARGSDWHTLAWDLNEHLRSIKKWGEDPDKAAFAEEMQKTLHDMMEGRGLSFEE